MTDVDVKVQAAGELPEVKVEGFGIQEAKAMRKLLARFMKEYGKKPAGQSDQEWLKGRFLAELPEMDEAEAEKLSRETVEAVREYDRNLASLHESRAGGHTAEEWFAAKSQEAAAGMSAAVFGQRMEALDAALENANAQMMRTVTTQSGAISRQLNLDGFIAEQHHVNSFNAAAQASESPFYAEVCVPDPGQTYGKNSFDIVIRDQADRIVHQYQCKYGADADATIQMLKRGNYNNQTILVPPDQVEQVQAAFPGKTVVSHIGGTDKVAAESSPLTKAEAKELQTKTQEYGKITELDWSSYDTGALAKFVGKGAVLAGVQGAVLATGFHLAGKVAADEPIETEEVVKVALETGADAGIKSATAGALKVAAEKELIGILPKGTPMAALVNVACVAIENVKILAKVAKGDLTLREGLDHMGCNTVAMTYGLGWGMAGAGLGMTALGWIPLVGPLVGGLAGGMIGYMAGSTFGQKVYEGAKKAVTVARDTAKKMWDTTKSIANKAATGLKSLFRRGRQKLFG